MINLVVPHKHRALQQPLKLIYQRRATIFALPASSCPAMSALLLGPFPDCSTKASLRCKRLTFDPYRLLTGGLRAKQVGSRARKTALPHYDF